MQIWDVARRKEVRRIDTPPGLRGSSKYALLTPDGKTLYVPVEKRSVKRFERAGKRAYRIEYAGEIRVWDVPSGKEKAPLRPAEGSAPAITCLAPNGRLLVCVERPSYDSADSVPKDLTVVWDLATGKKWKLSDGFVRPVFAPDSKTAVASEHDFEAKTAAVKVLDLTTGEQLARLTCPEKDRFFSIGQMSPDGAIIAVKLGGKKAALLEVWFLDARTLEGHGKLVGTGDPEGYGWGSGAFTPDGKRYVALDGVGNALVWDVSGQKRTHTLSLGGNSSAHLLAISPDGKTAAVGWAPKGDADLENIQSPDPQDLPQPRVSLIDLTGNAPPRILMAPHGYQGSLAFSPDGNTLAFGARAVHLFDLRK